MPETTLLGRIVIAAAAVADVAINDLLLSLFSI
jgi:hypothetical protein